MPTTLTLEDLRKLGIVLDAHRYGQPFTLERMDNGGGAVFDESGCVVATISRPIYESLFGAEQPVEPPTFWERLESGVE